MGWSEVECGVKDGMGWMLNARMGMECMFLLYKHEIDSNFYLKQTQTSRKKPGALFLLDPAVRQPTAIASDPRWGPARC